MGELHRLGAGAGRRDAGGKLMWGIPGLTLQLLIQGVATLALLGGVAWLVSGYNNAIALKEVAKIDRANDNATFKGKRAAARSADRGVRGTRDPSTRDD